ncbi:hypothetical protein LCGC14_2719400 [marine sediment metagenome]|uniref:Uncharacterized protein n=1 Tax=marine sediment metagenome TaxID=412755 RepID=A0A0F9C292_9ZZZZ
MAVIGQIAQRDNLPLQHRGDVIVAFRAPQVFGPGDLAEDAFAFVVLDDVELEVELAATDSGLKAYPYAAYVDMEGPDGPEQALTALCTPGKRIDLG